jgi:hypothetical protein
MLIHSGAVIIIHGGAVTIIHIKSKSRELSAAHHGLQSGFYPASVLARKHGNCEQNENNGVFNYTHTVSSEKSSCG